MNHDDVVNLLERAAEMREHYLGAAAILKTTVAFHRECESPTVLDQDDAEILDRAVTILARLATEDTNAVLDAIEEGGHE